MVIFSRLFTGDLGNGWSILDVKCGRVAAKSLRMSDGTLSFAGIGKGFIIIYRQDGELKDFRSLLPIHVLLEATIENLSKFYTPIISSEVYSVYKRFNRIRSD